MNLLIPDEDVDISNPSLEVIESAVRKSFTGDENATVFVYDDAKNLFIQNIGDHIEHTAVDGGPVYACDGVDVETAV